MSKDQLTYEQVFIRVKRINTTLRETGMNWPQIEEWWKDFFKEQKLKKA